MRLTLRSSLFLVTLVCAGVAPVAQAAVFVVPIASFAAPQVTFESVALSTPLNGLTTNGFTFAETSPGTTIVFDSTAGPGNTNNVTGQVGLSTDNPAGRLLTVNLPGLSSAFGFGYASLDTALPNATTITLFNGSTNVGSLSFASLLDPTFPGGFAGIGSTLPFTRATISFPTSTSAYAVDDFRVTAVPEPGSMLLLGAGLAGLVLLRARQARS